MIKSSIAVLLIFGFVAKTTSTAESQHQNGYGNGGTGTPGVKAKKIQIVYIKVPLSKVLQTPNNGYNSGGNTGERGYSEGGGGVNNVNNVNNGGGRGFEGSPGVGIPGEGRIPNYSNNNIGVVGNVGEGYRGFGSNDNYGASSQTNFGKTNRPENYGGEGIIYDSEDGTSGGGFGNGGGSDNINYQNDANLGIAYGAAVGNALPQNANYDDSANYGQESQNSGYTQTNQIGFNQNDGYVQNGPNSGYTQSSHNNGFGPNGQTVNSGYGQEIGADNYEKGKMLKGNQHFPKMIPTTSYQPQMPIMAIPSFAMKGFSSPSFSSAGFPSFGGKGFGGTSFGNIGSMSGIGGITGMTGFGGIKNKLSMLLGNKFGMGGGGGGGLLSGMMGWD